jgi:4-amino-4-deoxy-L-arabinose transferase-like glycosyltransferase
MAGRIFTSARMITPSTDNENKDQWLQSRATIVALAITLLGFLARIWMASGIFLNPDEALHFRLANQLTLPLAYREGLTASHPPLLTFILYFWRALGTSELWLRMPSVLAGAAFCWMFYKWLSRAAGTLAALIGLLFVAFLPPIIQIAAEVRQYSLLLAFLAAALYFLDKAFAGNSTRDMAAFSLCLYLAMLSHYSAFLFAAALGLYVVIQIVAERPPIFLVASWAAGQLIAIALAVFFYKTHLAKLGVGDSRTVSQGWMSEFYLRHSYFDRAHDNPVMFLLTHSFGVFQYFFEQPAIGDVMGLFFIAGIVLLLRGKILNQDRDSSRQFAALLLLPFAAAGAVALTHIYPYGGTRHVALLIIPAVAGVSVAIAHLAAGRWNRGIVIAVVLVVVCIAFGKPRRPRMDRSDQNRGNMAEAMQFLNENAGPSEMIFTDYQSDLILGHYLCREQPIAIEISPADFEQFSCAGHRVAATDYKTAWILSDENFSRNWQHFMRTYALKPGTTVWIFQAGWNADLPEDLRNRFPAFSDLHFQSFGNNIKLFKMTVGQIIPSVITLTSLPAHSFEERLFNSKWAAPESVFSSQRRSHCTKPERAAEPKALQSRSAPLHSVPHKPPPPEPLPCAVARSRRSSLAPRGLFQS